MFAHISQKPHVKIAQNFLWMLSVAVALSVFVSDVVCICGFVDDIVFVPECCDSLVRCASRVASCLPGCLCGWAHLLVHSEWCCPLLLCLNKILLWLFDLETGYCRVIFSVTFIECTLNSLLSFLKLT